MRKINRRVKSFKLHPSRPTVLSGLPGTLKNVSKCSKNSVLYKVIEILRAHKAV